MYIWQKYIPQRKGNKRKITDVTGAGDTVICFASLGFCENLDATEIAKISNYAGFLSCKKIGTSTVNRNEFTKT